MLWLLYIRGLIVQQYSDPFFTSKVFPLAKYLYSEMQVGAFGPHTKKYLSRVWYMAGSMTEDSSLDVPSGEQIFIMQ